MDAVAKLASIALQYGVPLDDLAPKMRNTRFEPYGPTGNPQIPGPPASSTTSSTGSRSNSSARKLLPLILRYRRTLPRMTSEG